MRIKTQAPSVVNNQYRSKLIAWRDGITLHRIENSGGMMKKLQLKPYRRLVEGRSQRYRKDVSNPIPTQFVSICRDERMSATDFTIAICDRCGGAAQPGAKLHSALIEFNTADRFRLRNVSCFAGCNRPLAVAFTAPNKASYLFGDIDPDSDVEALRAFGRFYHLLPDGWSREGERPAGLRGKTLARIPFLPGPEETFS
ncbi:DUF1636 domain-containing protein [Rhizobium wenxiniae]